MCSIFSNSGHVGWCTASPDTILKLDTIVIILTKFGFHWSSTFRGEDFWKSLRQTMDDDDGRQVMAIAHVTLQVRWAKNFVKDHRRNIQSYVKLALSWGPYWISAWHKKWQFCKGPSNDYSCTFYVQYNVWFLRKLILLHFPIGSYVKTLWYGGGHLVFLIDKIMFLHPSNLLFGNW